MRGRSGVAYFIYSAGMLASAGGPLRTRTPADDGAGGWVAILLFADGTKREFEAKFPPAAEFPAGGAAPSSIVVGQSSCFQE